MLACMYAWAASRIMGLHPRRAPTAKVARTDAIAAGADGVMLEVHNDPEEALSDGFQSLYLDSMAELITSLKRQAQASGRTFNLKSLVKETV